MLQNRKWPQKTHDEFKAKEYGRMERFIRTNYKSQLVSIKQPSKTEFIKHKMTISY